MKRNFLKIYILVYIFFALNSCTTNISNQNSTKNSFNDKIIKCIDYTEYNIGLYPVEIIVPMNQTIAQGLSILVTDNSGNLIVFDGGRIGDADYLCDVIKDKGGIVKYWFITHIHDDHIGALWQILNSKRTDIVIENLYYDFASFDWYYDKMGNDAGIYNLFVNAIKDYNEFMKSNKNSIINVLDKPKSNFVFTSDNALLDDDNKDIDSKVNTEITVEVLNKHYEFDHDPINNTSIVYMIKIKLGDKNFNMLILGDLGYEGGKELFNDNFNEIIDNGKRMYSYSVYNLDAKQIIENVDIITLSHHGQNGIDPELYKKFNPKIIIWPTSKDIYENINNKYYTDDTKASLNSIDSIKYQILSYMETALIR